MSNRKLAQRRLLAARDASQEFVLRRTEIVFAAAEMFADRGYEQATLADVGRRVGLKRASIYYYFASKEELLQEVIHEAISANLDRVREIGRSDLSPTEKLRAVVVDMMESYERNFPHQYVYVRADTRRLWAEGDEKTREILTLSSEYREEIEVIVEEGIASGAFRDLASGEVLTYAIVGMVNWTQRWFEPGSGRSGRELGAVFAELALLRPDQTGELTEFLSEISARSVRGPFAHEA